MKKFPLWNWIVLLYPLGTFFYFLDKVPLYFAWAYAVSNVGYLLAVITIYPGRFLLFGLKTRVEVFIFAAVAWITGVVFTNL